MSKVDFKAGIVAFVVKALNIRRCSLASLINTCRQLAAFRQASQLFLAPLWILPSSLPRLHVQTLVRRNYERR